MLYFFQSKVSMLLLCLNSSALHFILFCLGANISMTEISPSENGEDAKKMKKNKRPKLHEKTQVFESISTDKLIPTKIQKENEQSVDRTAHVKDGMMGLRKVKKKRIKPQEITSNNEVKELSTPLKKKRKEGVNNDDNDVHLKKNESNLDDTKMSVKTETRLKKKGLKKKYKLTKRTRVDGENRKILESLLEKTAEPNEKLENVEEISDINANEGDELRNQETEVHLDGEDKIQKGGIVKKCKKRKNKERDKKKEGNSEQPEQPSAKTQALAYLDLWKNNRNDWSFKKVRQKWLIKNLYNNSEVDEKKFKILLEYLSAAKGAARKLMIEEAESIFVEVDKNNVNVSEQGDSQNTNVDLPNCKLLRARQILQTLSE